MMIEAVLAFAMLLFGAGITIHLEEVEGVTPDAAREVLDALAGAVQARTGTTAVIDNPVWAGCETGDRCLDAIRARTRSDALVMVRIFSAPKSTFVVTERIDPRLGDPRSATVTLEGDARPSPEAFTNIAAELFPPGRPRPPAAAAAPAAIVAEDPLPLGPLIVIGASAALAIGGVAFGASSASAKERGEMEVLAQRDSEAFTERAETHAYAANVFFGAAIAGAVAGLVWWIAD